MSRTFVIDEDELKSMYDSLRGVLWHLQDIGHSVNAEQLQAWVDDIKEALYADYSVSCFLDTDRSYWVLDNQSVDKEKSGG